MASDKALSDMKAHAQTQDFFMPENIKAMTAKLTWNRENAFNGQILPPRPSPAELAASETPLGPLVSHKGVVLQGGPHRSIFLRAGCVARYQWVQMWNTLRQLITHYLDGEITMFKKRREEGGDPYKSKIIYVVVSLRAMQAIDFGWLYKHGFTFHHYREAGHGDTDPDSADANPEYVYKCFPGRDYQDDPVPAYATSIEGAFALILSPDGTKVLLVWERQSWSCPGGTVNIGESKVEAVAREVNEEVGVVVDDSMPMEYLGGYSQGRARDNLVNDNFAAFAVRVKSEEIKVDRKEIFLAKWFDCRRLVEAWRAKGHEMTKRVEGLSVPELDDPERNRVNGSALQWMESYVEGRGLTVKVKQSQQGNKTATRAAWNMP